jgi:hypothetical protein
MRFSKVIAKIVEFIVVALIVLSLVFILTGLKSTETNWVFIGIGIVLAIPILLYFFITDYQLSSNAKFYEKRYKTDIQDFKKTADKIPIDLGLAVVEERNRYETRITEKGDSAALNAAFGYSQRNEETIEHTFSKVTFKTKYKGKTLKFTETIHAEPTTVRMHFFMQKETFMYINPSNPDDYFIDLIFLSD